jgi:hypothetical protein
MVVVVADRAQQVLNDDYEEVLERLRVADFLYTEYSLEEVIYQLAKVMFSQSLNRGQHRMQDTTITELGRCNGAFLSASTPPWYFPLDSDVKYR